MEGYLFNNAVRQSPISIFFRGWWIFVALCSSLTDWIPKKGGLSSIKLYKVFYKLTKHDVPRTFARGQPHEWRLLSTEKNWIFSTVVIQCYSV